MQVYKLHFTKILVSIHLFPFRLTFFLLLLNVFEQNKTLKGTRDRIKLMERTECLISRWYRMQCVFFSIAEANSSDDRQRNSRRKFDEFDFAFESRLGPWLSRE